MEEMDLEEVGGKHKIRKNCDNKEARFIKSKPKKFVVPHFYIIWKIFKNPVVCRPTVAGYNWILTPASIFVGRYFLIQSLRIV